MRPPHLTSDRARRAIGWPVPFGGRHLGSCRADDRSAILSTGDRYGRLHVEAASIAVDSIEQADFNRFFQRAVHKITEWLGNVPGKIQERVRTTSSKVGSSRSFAMARSRARFNQHQILVSTRVIAYTADHFKAKLFGRRRAPGIRASLVQSAGTPAIGVLSLSPALAWCLGLASACSPEHMDDVAGSSPCPTESAPTGGHQWPGQIYQGALRP
jgi:hypothetical protein